MGTIKKKIRNFKKNIGAISDGKWDFFVVAMDYIYCRVRYRIPYDEYVKYNFYNLKDRYRKNFILQKHRPKFKNVNLEGFTKSKYVFYEYIPDLYTREMILAPFCGEETFVDFLRRQKKIVVKPDRGSLGVGLEVVEYTNDTAAQEYFKTITKVRPMICEEFIHQHPTLSRLNPASVNTVRIASLLKDGEVEILAAILKTGAGDDSILDNLSQGGIGAQIDVTTGVVCSFGRDFHFHAFTHHPTSGAQILGLQIPHWDKAIALVKEAHKRLPQCMIYGWDIAITETGVDIVEANSKPGTRIMQVMDAVPKGKNVLPLIKKDRLKEKRREYHLEFIPKYLKYLEDK